MRNSIDKRLAKLAGTLALKRPSQLLIAKESRRRFVIYRAYDETGDLLYIGKSKNWTRRFRDHYNNAGPWIDVLTTLRLQEFPDEIAMDAAETAAIAAEKPRFNCETKPDPHALSDEELTRYKDAT